MTMECLNIKKNLVVFCVMVLVFITKISESGSVSSKRAAWIPQGRMGKRGDLNDKEQNKKAYWEPQGRFGKRTGQSSDEVFENNKRIPRMGLYQKKDDDFPRMGYLNKRQHNDVNTLEKIKNQIDTSIIKYIALLRKNYEESSNKRAAWVPQGRFGKRSSEKGMVY